MTPSVETLKRFLTLLVNVYTTGEVEPQLYSGRGMYGSNCLGIVTQDPLILMFELGEMSYETKNDTFDDTGKCSKDSKKDQEDLIELLTACSSNICQDSMGLSSIVYFPCVMLTFEEHQSVFEEFENGH
jgi:hypothetical protein